jgi:hypothetical protein
MRGLVCEHGQFIATREGFFDTPAEMPQAVLPLRLARRGC